MPKLPYTKTAYYANKAPALKEAARLRRTGRYNAKVLRNTGPDKRSQWVLWTQLKVK